MSTQTIAIGRIVHYILDQRAVDRIMEGRALAGIGSSVAVGEVLPAMIVDACSGAYAYCRQDLKVFLKGSDNYFAAIVQEDQSPDQDTPGTWHWPPITQPRVTATEAIAFAQRERHLEESRAKLHHAVAEHTARVAEAVARGDTIMGAHWADDFMEKNFPAENAGA